MLVDRARNADAARLAPGPGDARRCSRHPRTGRRRGPPRRRHGCRCGTPAGGRRERSRSPAASRCCASTAHCTASTALGNSARTLSPAVLTIRPPCSAMSAVHDLPALGQQAQGADLVRAHQPRIAGHVRREDGGELALDSLDGVAMIANAFRPSACLVGQRALIASPYGSRKGARSTRTRPPRLPCACR